MLDVKLLCSVPLFQGLGEDELSILSQLLQARIVPSRVNLICMRQQNRYIYFLQSGTVKIYTQPEDDAEVVLNILGPGEALGEISAIDGTPASASVQTLESCDILALYCDNIVGCLMQMPRLLLNLLQLQNRRMRRLTAHTESLATLDVEARLARQLLLFARDYGITSSIRNGGMESAVRIPLRLTQTDLAALCGSSVKQIYRAMSEYQDQGIISVGTGYRITISHPEKLRRYVSLHR